MAIRTTCPDCRTSYTLADTTAGKTVRCKQCGQPFVVREGPPGRTAIAAEPDRRPSRRDEDEAPRSRTKRDRRDERDDEDERRRPAAGSGFPWVLLLVLGGVGGLLLVVLGCGGLAFFLLRPSGPPTQVAVNPVPDPVIPPPPEKPADIPLPPPGQQPPPIPDAPPDNNKRPRPRPRPEAPPGNGEPLEPPVVAWQVRPDPLPETVKGPFDLSAAIPMQGFNRIICPSQLTPFVTVTATDVKEPNRVRTWDLRSMKPLGGVIDLTGSEREILGPDGAYLAARSGRQDARPTAHVWSTASGEKVQSIEVDADLKMRIGRLDFAGKDRLLTAKHDGDFPFPEQKTTYQVWDVKTGQELTHFDVDLVFDPKWVSISPGGRYLAMEDTAGGHYYMLFYDLTTGKLAAKFQLQTKQDRWGQASGIAFSRDGKEVALLWRYGDKPTWARLFCWDMASGRKVLDIKIPHAHPAIDLHWGNGGPRSIQWLPDNKGWLISERLVFDRTGAFQGDIAPEMRERRDPRDRRFLDRDHLVARIAVPGRESIRITRAPTPGKPDPSDEVGHEGAIPWQVKVDPPPEPAGPAAPVNLRGAVPLGGLGEVLYPWRYGPFVAVTTPTPRGDGSRVWDLRRMKPLGPVIPFKTSFPTSLSSDGGLVAFVISQGNMNPTIQVWSGRTGRPVRAIEVDNDASMKIEWLEVIAPNRVLTVKRDSDAAQGSDKCKYQVWDLESGKEVCHFTHNLGFHAKWGGISPGGRYLALEDTAHGHYYMLFWDLTTGKPAGKFQFQGEKERWGQAGGLIFSPDGKELALIWRYGVGQEWGRLFCWDVATGKKLHDHKILPVHQAIEYKWTDGDHRSFQWLPDGKGWLIAERFVFERDGTSRGDIAPEWGDDRQAHHLRFLDADHVTLAFPGVGGRVPQIRAVKVPAAQKAAK
jgi:predicted Zn finger-like uncharacterized protein